MHENAPYGAGAFKKFPTMTRKFIPKNYIFNADTKTQSFFSEHIKFMFIGMSFFGGINQYEFQ